MQATTIEASSVVIQRNVGQRSGATFIFDATASTGRCVILNSAAGDHKRGAGGGQNAAVAEGDNRAIFVKGL